MTLYLLDPVVKGNHFRRFRVGGFVGVAPNVWVVSGVPNRSQTARYEIPLVDGKSVDNLVVLHPIESLTMNGFVGFGSQSIVRLIDVGAISLLLQTKNLVVVAFKISLVAIDVRPKAVKQLNHPPLRIPFDVWQFPVAFNNLFMR